MSLLSTHQFIGPVKLLPSELFYLDLEDNNEMGKLTIATASCTK